MQCYLPVVERTRAQKQTGDGISPLSRWKAHVRRWRRFRGIVPRNYVIRLLRAARRAEYEYHAFSVHSGGGHLSPRNNCARNKYTGPANFIPRDARSRGQLLDHYDERAAESCCSKTETLSILSTDKIIPNEIHIPLSLSLSLSLLFHFIQIRINRCLRSSHFVKFVTSLLSITSRHN